MIGMMILMNVIMMMMIVFQGYQIQLLVGGIIVIAMLTPLTIQRLENKQKTKKISNKLNFKNNSLVLEGGS